MSLWHCPTCGTLYPNVYTCPTCHVPTHFVQAAERISLGSDRELLSPSASPSDGHAEDSSCPSCLQLSSSLQTAAQERDAMQVIDQINAWRRHAAGSPEMSGSEISADAIFGNCYALINSQHAEVVRLTAALQQATQELEIPKTKEG